MCHKGYFEYICNYDHYIFNLLYLAGNRHTLVALFFSISICLFTQNLKIEFTQSKIFKSFLKKVAYSKNLIKAPLIFKNYKKCDLQSKI